MLVTIATVLDEVARPPFPTRLPSDIFTNLVLGAAPGALAGALVGWPCGLAGYRLRRVLARRGLAILTATGILCCAAAMAYGTATPRSETAVPWPAPGVVVSVQKRGLVTYGWWLRAETLDGVAWASLVPDTPLAAAASPEAFETPLRFNLYRTPQGAVAVLGTGGDRLALVRVPPGDGPAPAHDAEAGTWTCLGVAYHDRSGALAFAGADAAPECVAVIEGQGVPGRAAASRSDGRP